MMVVVLARRGRGSEHRSYPASQPHTIACPNCPSGARPAASARPNLSRFCADVSVYHMSWSCDQVLALAQGPPTPPQAAAQSSMPSCATPV